MSNLNINRVCIAGHLTRDPLLRKTAGGSAVADISLAINESYKSKDGKSVEQTCYVDVTLWARSAEIAQCYLHKGDPLLVEGRLAFDQWESERGERRSKLRVTASRIHFVGGKRSNRNGNDEEPAAQAELQETERELADVAAPF